METKEQFENSIKNLSKESIIHDFYLKSVEYDSLRDKSVILKERNKDLNDESTDLTKENVRLKEEYTTSDAMTTAYYELQESSKDKIEKYRLNTVAANKEIRRLKAENESLNDKIIEYRKTMTMLMNQVNELNLKWMEQFKLINDLEEENEQLKADIKVLEGIYSPETFNEYMVEGSENE